jgi:hypothetical protein
MLINVQYHSAAELMWELLAAIPECDRNKFAHRVDEVASLLCHPNLDGAVVFSFCGDGALQSPVVL